MNVRGSGGTTQGTASGKGHEAQALLKLPYPRTRCPVPSRSHANGRAGDEVQAVLEYPTQCASAPAPGSLGEGALFSRSQGMDLWGVQLSHGRLARAPRASGRGPRHSRSPRAALCRLQFGSWCLQARSEPPLGRPELPGRVPLRISRLARVVAPRFNESTYCCWSQGRR